MKHFARGVAAAAVIAAAAPTAAAGELYIPVPAYRIGPYADGGSGYFGGVIDYYTLLNMRDGGIGGMKLVWDECETEYDRRKGVECYRRLRELRGGKGLFFDPLSTDISAALIAAGRRDRTAIIAVNHGRTEGQRGDVFPYYFMPGINTYDEHSIMLAYVGRLEGGMEMLRGKKIAMLYHGSPYGREAVDFMDSLCEKRGCEHRAIEVKHPGNEQTAQWLKIRGMKPDYVFLRGWGVMNPVAMQTAVRVGFPIDRLIGNVWSNSESDVRPAGAAADGYQAITTHPGGMAAPVLDEIAAAVYGAGRGDLQDRSRIGAVRWNLGVMAGVIHAEAVRVAQKRFGPEVTSAQVRWGFENLNLDAARLAELGAAGLVPEIKTTCMDHVGGHRAKVIQWEHGADRWRVVSGWIEGDLELSQSVIDAKAERAVRDEGIVPRDCSDPEERDDFDL